MPKVIFRFHSLCLFIFLNSYALSMADPGELVFQARSRSMKDDGEKLVDVMWSAKKTAVVVCDMWTKHWCDSASRRCAEMAPRINEFISVLRARGVLIIHCPSSGVKYYEDTPMREIAKSAPAIKTKIPLQDWCALDNEREKPLPIDDSDNGCDCLPRCQTGSERMNLRQISSIKIFNKDAITDSAEAYYLMKQRGIKNVIVLGVHTNMCVLGRPFSIRQMVYQGQNVVLVRDLTDTMYNPRSRPYVSHARGTELVVEHIEKYWCPTITSDQIIGGRLFQFSDILSNNQDRKSSSKKTIQTKK